MSMPLLSLDRYSKEPLYRQLRRSLQSVATSGLFAPDQPLPSSRALAEELHVSRNTVNLAYQELIAEGVVVSRSRTGLFVNPQLHAAISQAPTVRSGIDWRTRTRTFPDIGMPHIEKVPDWHTYPYPFLAGQVDVGSFPVRGWLRALRESMYHPHIYPALQDSLDADDPLLVEAIRRQLLPARGIEAAASEVLITVGSQHGLDLIGRSLLGADSVVAIEDPGYPDARRIFARTGAGLRNVPVDADGARLPDDLHGIDLVYVTPSHQSPTNVTMSMPRRLRLVANAADAGSVIVEDDYDSEFRYQGSPSPALKALDTRGDVVYLGTFSKFLSPGLRLGYIVGHPDLIEQLRVLRRYELRHPSGLLQRAMALFITSGDYHRALGRHRLRLERRWHEATDSVDRHLPFPTGPFPPGGVSLWIKGPPGTDARSVCARARERGVLIETGDVYFAGPGALTDRCFRIGYGAIPTAAIEPGITLLGEVCHELTARMNGAVRPLS